MINITNSLISFLIFSLSVWYFKIFTLVTYNQKITQDNILKIFVKTFLNELLGIIQVNRLRGIAKNSLVQSSSIIVIRFISVVVILFLLAAPRELDSYRVMLFMGAFIISFLVYVRFTYEVSCIIDQDSFLKNKAVILFSTVLLMIVANTFELKSHFANIILNIIFMLISLRQVFNTSFSTKFSKNNLFKESMRISWLVGMSYLVVGYYCMLINYWPVNYPLVLEGSITIVGLSTLVVMHRQRARQLGQNYFIQFIKNEMQIILFLCVLRAIAWKF